jgi:hypothetical protein
MELEFGAIFRSRGPVVAAGFLGKRDGVIASWSGWSRGGAGKWMGGLVGWNTRWVIIVLFLILYCTVVYG